MKFSVGNTFLFYKVTLIKLSEWFKLRCLCKQKQSDDPYLSCQFAWECRTQSLQAIKIFSTIVFSTSVELESENVCLLASMCASTLSNKKNLSIIVFILL